MKPGGDLVKNNRGQIVPSQRLASGELVFLAQDIPPLGGRRFTVEAGRAGASGAARAEGPGAGRLGDDAETGPELRRDCQPARGRDGP